MRTWGTAGVGLGVALVACAGRFGDAGGSGGAALRLAAPDDVRWEEGGTQEVVLAIENSGSSAVRVPPPSPERARVAVYRGGDATPVCSTPRREVAPVAPVVELPPGGRARIAVSLDACRLAPGEYRFEGSYDLGDPAGVIGPERGRIVVSPASAAVDFPASRRAVEPPADADAAGAASANPHLRPRAPPLGAASLACVDDVLARRGLNAHGDPAGTVYPDGPPTFDSEVERRRMVLERYPDIGTICRVVP
jgi:hypothetical protein